ncbi:superfamily II DNA or RNA helicase [Microbacterium resistens]|uniref:Superfamily II DNA or RNA helicase n=1 Tax=Microbacterium resistens TaxID=156977 RepID=A0ABU1SGE0_9MICO|nr:DEAD/DEAH box helicase [Microbacterium resistens]MDR6868622.1 superfamily II DNA or RNA helicase [Microbacterium resistens]
MPSTATTARSTAASRKKTSRRDDEAPLIPILARKVREIEAKAQRGKLGPTNRVKFQVIAFLVREERARVKTDTAIAEGARSELLKRLDGVATILAKTAARDTSLIQLLEADQATSPVAKRMRRDWLLESGAELAPEELIITDVAPVQATVVPAALAERQVTPPSVEARMMANPFLPPDLTPRAASTPRRRLDGWELMGPLYKAFETGAGGSSASMDLPPLPEHDHLSPKGLEVMVHQSRFLESVRAGHRSFLLADEPGLGKTAQSVLAASVADAYPLLVVVPNVVKMNWAREVERWTPQRRAAVIQGDGADIDAFADVFIVNYEILDRHLSWLGAIGLRGMVVDEAHFIKNLSSQRSQNVLALSSRVRAQTPGGAPLLMALTGTPLINDVEDFDAIWRFLGWTTGDKPATALMEKLEGTGFTPADKAFYAEARDAVISMGIVRRKKVDVAADLPDKLIADLPVQLDDEYGRSIREAERELGERMAAKYRRIIEARGDRGLAAGEIDEDIVRLVAHNELEESKAAGTGGDNVFTMVRRIGQAKAQLAADYAAQLQRSVGKVVFFAKHIDVMDRAEAHFAASGIRAVSIRGDQTTPVRQQAIDDFNEDPEVGIAVCSLTAAGVGVNLQAASNVVLAELSWTAAEQTQAIDRVHRIGQDEPVTAWRIIAAHTIDTKIAELIDQKQGLAARALDGETVEETASESVQMAALTHLLRQALGGE